MRFKLAVFFSHDGTIRTTNTATTKKITDFLTTTGISTHSCEIGRYKENIKKHFPEIGKLIKKRTGVWRVHYPNNYSSESSDYQNNENARLTFSPGDTGYRFYANFVLVCE